MAVWLMIYAGGFFVAMAAVASVAHARRTSHQMSQRTVVQLTLSAGLVWPLLAVAGVQVAMLVILKTVLCVMRGRDVGAVAMVDESADPVLQPLAVAAA